MTTRHHPSAFQLRPLRCIIVVSLTLASLTATAQIAAQTPAVAESGAARVWNLPVAPLADTLAHIARDSGYRLSADPALVAGKTAAAVRGNLSAIDAVRQALAGTGLKLIVTEGGTLSVQPAPASSSSPVTTLTEMTVTGAAINPGVTESTGSYTASQSSYGKGQTLKELPQTVTVMTRQRIDDQQLKTLDDLMIYTPGITVEQNSTSTSSFYSRGFEITNYQIDGNSPLLSRSTVTEAYAGNLSTSQLDLAMFDRVEVLRGSDALYGTSGEPGGAINLVRKKPTNRFQLNALAHAGSWNNYRGELDVSGPIIADGRIRGRLVGVYEDRKYFYDYGKSDKYLFYGIVEADITNSTLLTLGGDFMRQDSTNNWRFGLPRYSNGTDIGLPRSTFFGGPDDRWQRNNNKQFVRIDQSIGADWTFGIEASRSRSKVDESTIVWWSAIDPMTFSGLQTATGRGRRFDRDETQKTLDAVLKGSFHLLGREHKVILGANISRYKGAVETNQRIGSNVQIPNIFEFNPADYRFNDPYFLANESDTIITQKGFYGSLAAKIADPLTLIIGGRFSWYKYNSAIDLFDRDTGAITSTSLTRYQDNTIFTPYLGLVYELTKQWSAYGSIAETYKPQAIYRKGPLLPGTPLNPITGRSYEIGIKGNLFNERLNTALAFFSIKRNGQAVQDPAYPPSFDEGGSVCCYLDDGRITSRGVDIEVSGEIVSGWQVLAGYTFNNNENKVASGRYSTVTPKHLFKLWSTYELKGILNGLKLGGGITAQSSNYRQGSVRTFNQATGLYDGPSVDYEFTEPGYVLVDLFAQYRLNKHWSANLNVNNIFDKKYYQTVGNINMGNWYGAPRNFLVSMQYSY